MKKVVLKSLVALLAANLSFAEEAAKTVEAVQPAANPELAKTVETAQSTAYPERNIDRPSFLPPGLVETDLNLSSSGLSKNTLGFDSGIAVGVTKHMHVRLGWSGMAWNNFELDDNSYRTLNFKLSHRLFSVPDIMGAKIHLNVPFNINIENKAVVDTASFATQFTFLLSDNWLLWMLNSDTVKIAPGQDGNITVQTKLPVSVGGQIAGNFWADLGTNLGTINYAYADSKFFWQELPLTLSGLYAFNNKVDLLASVGIDAINPAESLAFGLGVAYRPNA